MRRAVVVAAVALAAAAALAVVQLPADDTRVTVSAPTCKPVVAHERLTEHSSGDVFVVDASGRERQLTDDGLSICPDVSPDGRRVAYSLARRFPAHEDTSTHRIAVTDLETDARTVWPAHGEETSDFIASWSPDGEQIAFIRAANDGEWRFSLMVARADGTDQRELAQMDSFLLSTSAWSPDASRIAFLNRARHDSANVDLDVVDVDDGGRRTLVAGMPELRALDWSPDGEHIVASWHLHEPGSSGPFEIDVDGGDMAPLAPASNVRYTRDGIIALWSEAPTAEVGAMPQRLIARRGDREVAAAPFGALAISLSASTCVDASFVAGVTAG